MGADRGHVGGAVVDRCETIRTVAIAPIVPGIGMATVFGYWLVQGVLRSLSQATALDDAGLRVT